MKLNESLPNSFEYNGKEYHINLSFDRVLDMREIQQEELIDVDDKIQLMLEVLDIECEEEERTNVLEYVLYNLIYQVNEEDNIEYDLLGNPMKKTKTEQETEITLDFEQDASLIYSAFLQSYGINLFKEFGKLHWYEFLALIESAPENTLLYQVRNIRSWKPQKGDSKEYKRNMNKLKEAYKIRGKGA